MTSDGDALISTYINDFRKIRERNKLKELFEREMLLAFVRANVERIAEFPLLETEQNGISNILSKRLADHPCQELFSSWLNSFLNNLNHYNKILETTDKTNTPEAVEYKNALLNAEHILVQCIQGVVYAVGLAKDNSSHALVSTLGPDALSPLQELIKNEEADDSFWRALFQKFVIQRIEKAYEEIISQKAYSLSKDESLVVLRFHLNDVFRLSGAQEVEVERTRIQTSFENVSETEKGRKNLSCVTHYLQGRLAEEVKKKLDSKMLPHAARIVCMDKVAERLCALVNGEEHDEELRDGELLSDRQKYLEEQILSMAVGAIMATDIIKQDTVRACKELNPAELKQFAESLGNLERTRMKPALVQLYEFYFMHHLRKQAEEDSNKLQLRSIRMRKVAATELERLSEAGLTRIRQKKLFSQAPEDPHSVLFQPRTAAELQKLVKFLQIEEQPLRVLLKLWRDAAQKVDILVVLNLKQLSRFTTNLPQRVGEILGRFGIMTR